MVNTEGEAEDMDIDEVRATARDVLAPLVGAGAAGRINRPLVRALGKTGLLPRIFPQRLGGSAESDVPATVLCTLRESLAMESTEAETALACQGLGAYPIVQSARPEVAQRWIPQVALGKAVPAFALTEPEAGSDAAALSLRAEPDGDGWRLFGEKLWISNAPDADVYTVFARTTPDAGARGVTAFVVAGDSAGLSGDPLEMISPHAIGSLTFDGVRVGPDDVLGEVNAGFRVAMRTLDLFRPSVGAFALGMGQAALDAAVAYASQRTAFGQPIAAFQAVSHQLAEMATRLKAARMLVYDAARIYDEGVASALKQPEAVARRGALKQPEAVARRGALKQPEAVARRDALKQPEAVARRDALKQPEAVARRNDALTSASAMAKLYATETAQFVVDAAVQIHGARALQQGHLLEHLYREVRAPRIYEGTSEIQRTIIARQLLKGVPPGDA